jgi:hypothetical protein
VTARARYLLLLGGWTALVAVVMVAVPMAVRTRLPDPIAVEWGFSGAPEGSSDLLDFLLTRLVWWALIAALWGAFALRGVLPRRALAWVGAALGVFGVLMVGTVVLTIAANIDVADFRDAEETRGYGWMLLGSVAAGWLGWRLGRRRLHDG